MRRVILGLAIFSAACAAGRARAEVVKDVLSVCDPGENLLKAAAWRPWGKGFQRVGDEFVCDNGPDATADRGVSQHVRLDQTQPRPIIATAWSKADGIGGTRDRDYSLYLDLIHTDGTPLWGRITPFRTGTHDWQQAKVVVLPAKPVRSLSFHMLLRRHAGKAWFRGARLWELRTPKGSALFDTVAVTMRGPAKEGFQVRDVAAGSGFVTFDRGAALGLKLDVATKTRGGATFFDAQLTDTTGKDRAVTLVYAVPVAPGGLIWLADPRRTAPVEPHREYVGGTGTRAGMGKLSLYPLAAVARGTAGRAIGIDMKRPAVYRAGYNSATGELFLSYDLGLTREKPSARVAFCTWQFDAAWGFRSAVAEMYRIWPDQFRCRTPKQGLWMPFARISKVDGWRDFGFRFKEGTNETPWDDAHGIVTFRYTEPMTWWMRMPKTVPRTYTAALAHARQLADKGDRRARALLASGFHDEDGRLPTRLRDTPWCDGAVWSMNSSPQVPGEVTDFKNKWDPAIRERLYGPKRKGDLDGEYVDSSEGYMTDELNFRREHFATARMPLTFSRDTHRPAIFRGLIAAEYVRALAEDVHGMGKLMMANGAPSRLCWLAPWLDVMGTETNWHRGGRWRPMSDAEMLFRRVMCGPKPYCFLMNTEFERFSHARVEQYMKRCLAYGMFPGFFSHNASQGQYFTRPDLYNRDRPLFKKYVPLCKLVAEAGWQPRTLARSDRPKVHVERFGEKHLTVFNDSPTRTAATITLAGLKADRGRELVRGEDLTWKDGKATVALDAEDVAVIELK